MQIPLPISALLLSLALSCQSSAPQEAAPKTVDTGQVESALAASLQNGDAAWQTMVASGNPMMLVFWQSWCAGCVAEAPHVQAAFERIGDRLSIAGVVSGPDQAIDADHLQSTIGRLGLTYPQVRDRQDELTQLFDVTITPQIVILDRNRQVVFNGHELPQDLDAYLQ